MRQRLYRQRVQLRSLLRLAALLYRLPRSGLESGPEATEVKGERPEA